MFVFIIGFTLLGLFLFLHHSGVQPKLMIFRTDDSGVRRQQVTCAPPLVHLSNLSAFICARLNSTLLFCPRCGNHATQELCFSIDVINEESLAIMVKLLENSFTTRAPHYRHHVSHVLDVAEYLLLREDYLERIIPEYFLSDPLGARFNPEFFLSLRDLYVAGYTSLAKTLYILWDSREPCVVSLALRCFPDTFEKTDFFWD